MNITATLVIAAMLAQGHPPFVTNTVHVAEHPPHAVRVDDGHRFAVRLIQRDVTGFWQRVDFGLRHIQESTTLPRQTCKDCLQVRTRWTSPARLAIAAYGVGQMTDITVSAWLFGADRAHEANPLLKPFEDRPLALSLIKGSIAAGTVYLLIKTHRKHPRGAFLVATGLALLQGYVTYRNAQLTR
jgi:hypothetical protein